MNQPSYPNNNPAALDQLQDFKRIGGDSLTQLVALAKDATPELWQELQGTWVGGKGRNLIFLPGPNSVPSDKGNAIIVVADYIETLTISPAGAPARNRGGDVDQYVAALLYQQRISDKNTSEGLHIEDGMFLNLATIVDENKELHSPVFTVARSGTIPHGASIMLLGLPPQYADVKTFKIPVIDNTLTVNGAPIKDAPDGYGEAVFSATEGLQVELDKVDVSKIIVMELDSANSGGLLNVPFVNERAKVTGVRVTYWLEKVTDKTTGQQFDQLQYVQIVDLVFHNDFTSENKISWPHISYNTLVKQ